ncbi:ferredoxin reductase family protein [Desulfocurvibacter africanus]|uniref:Oxidoreductase FAD/NAD(P)-binding domain protein n=1 Tax=Desulfocurvibacter africanus subsp. africanus str. Walvis Bay TaxID=690850 RepID=F3YU05_DESAF|nr:ferredoxin reductase family protein [Desulfocurvibacter africanus]EGJ48611.1 oxidoreductase FAD/NAD(P)-binding domain protein [Desulfocurvibacter africanus subsp. africanus str. Walvis Bay]
MKRGLLLLLLYIVVLGSPLALSATLAHEASSSFLYELGRGLALSGATLLLLQVVLAARLKWVERPYGLDMLLRFHRNMAVLGLAMLIPHPIFLVLGGAGWSLLWSLDTPWYITVGRLALLVLAINVAVSLLRRRMKIRFERWRLAHDMLGPTLLVLVLLHSSNAGQDLKVDVMRTAWFAAFGIIFALFAYHRIVRPILLGRQSYRVVEVRPKAEGVWTIRLAPPKGHKRFDYLPGQFQFLTLHRHGRGLPEEEHHFTISSSPTETGYISSTVKAVGDFTATIGKTRPGDTATVHAAFGRFSYLFHPEDKDMVFIAGGIGITPLRSMLRHMHDTAADRRVLLLYANRREQDIVFRKELDEMAAESSGRLTVVHVLSKPGPEWRGESGHIDKEFIARQCGQDCLHKAFYLCGPPGLVRSLLQNLRKLGVPERRIRLEYFSFLD